MLKMIIERARQNFFPRPAIGLRRVIVITDDDVERHREPAQNIAECAEFLFRSVVRKIANHQAQLWLRSMRVNTRRDSLETLRALWRGEMRVIHEIGRAHV